MPISATCGTCHKKYRLRDDTKRKQFRCKECGKAVQIPQSAPAHSNDDFLDNLDDAIAMSAQMESLPETPSTAPLPPQTGKKRRSKKGSKTKSSQSRSNSSSGLLRLGLQILLFAFSATILVQLGSGFLELLGSLLPLGILAGLSKVVMLGVLLSVGATILGQVICLVSPGRMSTRLLLVAAMGAEALVVVSIVIGISGFAQKSLWHVIGGVLVGIILALVGMILFLLYLKMLSRDSGYPSGEDDVHEIFGLIGMGIAINLGLGVLGAIPGISEVAPYFAALAHFAIGIMIVLKYIELLQGLRAHLRNA